MLRVLSLVYPFKSLVLFSVPQAMLTRLPQLSMEEAMVIMDLRMMGIMVAIMDLRMDTMVAIIEDIMVDTVVDIMDITMGDTITGITITGINMGDTITGIGDSRA